MIALVAAGVFYAAAAGASVHVRTLAPDPRRGTYPARVSYRVHGKDTVQTLDLPAMLEVPSQVKLLTFPGEALPVLLLAPVEESRDSPTLPSFYRLGPTALQALPIVDTDGPRGKVCFAMPDAPVKLLTWDSSNPLDGRRHVAYYAARDGHGAAVVVQVADLFAPGQDAGGPFWTPPPAKKVAGMQVCPAP